MKRMLFNATQAEELRVAIVDGQELIDLDIETIGKEQRKGNIYKGIITRVEPSLEACFVDYGTDRHGFLPFKEISRSYFKEYSGGRPRIQEVIHEGLEVVVQVEKDERGNKGAALTTFVSLAGRYLVLMPNNPRGGGVSRRIEGDERQELKEAMRQLSIPNGMSLIARTAGIGRTVEELEWDLGYLLQLWTAIEEADKVLKAPRFLLEESSLIVRALRDYFQPDIGEILIDTEEVYQDAYEFVKNAMPPHLNKVKLYKDHTPLFSRYQIEHQIESVFSRSVNLPSGGAIVIDHTEALVSIDVNSARSTRGADIEETACKTNMEAAEEIARQLRLRDLGGLVVIDFIDMENSKNQKELEQTLRLALRHDRARIQMDKLSRFGLLELSRQRLRPSLSETSYIPCPRCFGTGFIRGIESSALHILRIVQEEAMKDNTGEIHAQVPVEVATFLLNEKRTELFAMEKRMDVKVFLIPNIHLETPHYKVIRVRTDDVDESANPSYQLVEKPEEEEIQGKSTDKIKAERQVPAVRGITRTQPAPQVAQTSVFTEISNWFKKLFAGTPPEPVKQPVKSRSPHNNQNRRNNQRRDNNKRNNRPNEKEDVEKNSNPQNAATNQATQKPERQQRGNNRNRPKDSQEQRPNPVRETKEPKTVANGAVVEAVAGTAPEKDNNATAPQSNNRRRRNNRRDRNNRPERQENTTQPLVEQLGAETAVTEILAPVKPLSEMSEQIKASSTVPSQPPAQTAASTELDIAQSVQYVHQSIAKVTGKPITVCEKDNQSAATAKEIIAEPVKATLTEEKPVPAETSAVTETHQTMVETATAYTEVETAPAAMANGTMAQQIPATAPFKPETIDLGELVMVQTKKVDVAQEEAIIQPLTPRLRRSDIQSQTEENTATQTTQTLQQIETQK